MSGAFDFQPALSLISSLTMITSPNDVIAAVATPVGEGGIAVIRISGLNAIVVADAVFTGSVPLREVRTQTAHVGAIRTQSGEIIDQVVALLFREPNSYTGENTVEVSCHGGFYVTRRLLARILEAGARMAEPGEFTRRAFLNGRIDLLQAEAVADLIHAKTELSHRTSVQRLEGTLSGIVRDLRNDLVNISSLLELELDFSEEGIDVADKHEIGQKISSVIGQLGKIAGTYRYGRISREGVRAVIVGKPNVGKSSIINNLLNENRAIVTDIPGTTRDVLREELDIEGILFTLSDTAGIRTGKDEAEKEGISRAHTEAMSADLILYVADCSEPVSDADRKIFTRLKESNSLAGTIIVGNKKDLLRTDDNFLREFISDDPNIILCSAKTGEGMDDLRSAMVRIAVGTDHHLGEKNICITSIRHKDAIEKAITGLEAALDDIRTAKSNEFISLNIRLAIESLGEIIGEVTTEDLLNNIFSKFCIGK